MDDSFQIHSEKRVLDFGRTITHGVRLKVLILLKAQPSQSAMMLHKKGVGPLSNVRYHMTQMESAGVIKVVKTELIGLERRVQLYDLTDFGLSTLRIASLISRQ